MSVHYKTDLPDGTARQASHGALYDICLRSGIWCSDLEKPFDVPSATAAYAAVWWCLLELQLAMDVVELVPPEDKQVLQQSYEVI